MTLNKRQSYFYLGVLAILAFILFSVFNNHYTTDSADTVIDRPWERHIVIYNWDYLKHRLYSLLGFYKEYPWTVQVSYSVIIGSSLAMVALLYVMFWDVYTRKKRDRAYRTLKADYYGKIKELVFSEQELTPEMISAKLQLAPDTPLPYADRLLFIDMLLELRMEAGITPQALQHIQQIVYGLGLYGFMENRLIAGKDRDKMKVIQAIRLLHMELSDSLMTRLINHREAGLRKAARLYYMLSNEEDPFRYFEENTTNNRDFLPWDQLEMHQLFEDYNRMNKKIPSFVPVLGQVRNRLFTAFFIKETAYWGSDKETEYLLGYLDSEEEMHRKASIESMAMRKTSQAEQLLKERYYRQPEHLRRTILHALFALNPAGSVPFFKEAYENSASLLTKRIALYCLWNVPDEGRPVFGQLKATARPNEQILFRHVENAIIGKETSEILSSIR